MQPVLVNGNKDYTRFVNNNGEELFNTNYDAQKWVKAKEATKLLVDEAHDAGHQLFYEYLENGAIDPFQSYQNMMFKRLTEGNKEIVFARPDTNHNAYDSHAQPRGTGGNGGLGVTQSLVDAFFMENGLPIDDPNSGYVEKGFSTEPEFRATNWIEVQGDQAGKEVRLPCPTPIICTPTGSRVSTSQYCTMVHGTEEKTAPPGLWLVNGKGDRRMMHRKTDT